MSERLEYLFYPEDRSSKAVSLGSFNRAMHKHARHRSLINRLDRVHGLIIVELPDGTLKDHLSKAFRLEPASP